LWARRRNHIYFVEAIGVNAIKIGIATNLDDRMEGLRGGCPTPIKMLLSIRGTSLAERRLHKFFDEERLHSEWFVGSDRLRSFIASLSTLDPKAISSRIRGIYGRVKAAAPPGRRPRRDRAWQRRRAKRLWREVDALFAAKAVPA
jgi:T5orf172 domain